MPTILNDAIDKIFLPENIFVDLSNTNCYNCCLINLIHTYICMCIYVCIDVCACVCVFQIYYLSPKFKYLLPYFLCFFCSLTSYRASTQFLSCPNHHYQEQQIHAKQFCVAFLTEDLVPDGCSGEWYLNGWTAQLFLCFIVPCSLSASSYSKAFKEVLSFSKTQFILTCKEV